MQLEFEPAEWNSRALVSRTCNQFSTRDLECEPGKTRMIGALNATYPIDGHNLEWKVFLLINPEGIVELGYTLMNQNPVAPFPTLKFNFTVHGTYNGTRWSSIHTVEGHRLPAFTRNPSYTRMWTARAVPQDRVVDPKISSVENYINPATKTLDISWKFEIWGMAKLKIMAIDASGVRRFFPQFDIREQPMLAAEFRVREPDLYLITQGGVVRAHLDKLCGECPFVRDAVARKAQRRLGYVWVDLGPAEYEIIWRIVALVYDCYYHGLEEHLVDMLVCAKRFNLQQLYVKLLRWVPPRAVN